MNNFTRHDAERLETLTQTVSAFKKKAGLTTLDVLLACRFALANKYDWEETIEATEEKHAEYIAYYDTGKNEEDAADRRVAELEAEVARLRQEVEIYKHDCDVTRYRTQVADGIGRAS